MAAASVVGVAWASAGPVTPGAAPLVPGEYVRLEGWLEVELDGGALLHLDGATVPLRSMPPGLAGRPVRVTGRVARPWHPRARPSVAVDSVAPWRGGGVDAPGVPPLTRAWMRTRLDLRIRARARIEAAFPRHAGLVAALVLADRSALPVDLRDRFARAGTAHLLAISGFHVGVLAGWAYLLLGLARVPRRRRPPVAAALVWLYVGVLGFPTSAVRAAILVSAVCVGRLRGRPTHPLGAWGLALALVALADPAALRGVGAQLSFAGSLGLILWARPWGRGLGGSPTRPGAPRRERFRRVVGVTVAATVAAQVATVALVVWHFQAVPLAGLPASVLATPPIAVALPGILLALLASPVPIASAVVAGGVEGLLSVTIAIVDVLGGAAGVVHLGPLLLAGPFIGALVGSALAAGAPFWRPRTGEPHRRRVARRRNARLRGALVGAWTGIGALPAATVVWPAPVEFHVLDVGQGDAIAIRSPRGAWTLVDAGPGRDDVLERHLARLGIRRIETLVLTHPDLDHVGGAAAVLAGFRVDRIVGPGLLRGTTALEEVLTAAARRRVAWGVVERGSRWESDGVRFEVVHAGGGSALPNDHSVVLHVAWGSFDALLTGDVTSEVEDRLPPRIAPDGAVELLKVAHHGSRTSSSGRFLDALAPAAAVVSVGRGNRFGHPAPDVLARYDARGIPLSRTDRHGSIRIRGRQDGSFRVAHEFGGPTLIGLWAGRILRGSRHSGAPPWGPPDRPAPARSRIRMSSFAPITLARHIVDQERLHPEASGAFTTVLLDVALAAKVISREVNRAGLADVLGDTGSENLHGDHVQKLDVIADRVMFKALDHSGTLACMGSEEHEELLSIPEEFPRGEYVILYDPLDGSSNIDVNVSIGTIFSLHRKITDGSTGRLKDALQPGSRQVAAGYVLYGSSTMLVYTTGSGVYGFTLDPEIGEFILSHPEIRIPEPGAATYSINEGNYAKWSPAQQGVVDGIKRGDATGGRPCKARYIGSMVADVHRTLLRGGIFMYPGQQDEPDGKLRLLYEGAPMALLVEQAGGRASTGAGPILEVQPAHLHQRTPVFMGSAGMVDWVERHLGEGARA